MKKIMEYIFISFLICFSFIYTDKVINIINKKDPLMLEIINQSDYYEVMSVNAIIEENTIIPGINGKEIDIDKSYNNMKNGGVFREDALIYKTLYPNDILSNNKDKYIIGGNAKKNEVSIIVILNEKDIDKIKSLNNITIFVNHKNLSIENIKKIKEHEIYSYGNGGIYDEDILYNDNYLINRLANNKSKYCLSTKENDAVIKVCSMNDMYTIIPSIIGGYYDVRNNLANGSIILLENIKDVDVIMRYISSKGYDIVTLNNLLCE